MPAIHGQARVRSEAGRIRVDTEIKGFGDPQQFGKEYLTYALFAITPEGRAQNLGEIIRDKNGKSSTQTFTTDLQTFGLIITAEPYFAVTQPSDLVVAENIIRKDTVGATEPINVHYELIGRGGYIAAPAAYQPLIIDQKLPFDLYQAQNAVRIAADNDAEKYAPDAFKRANDLLIQAQEYAARKKVQDKPVITVARQAVQQAQDALILTLRRKDAERLANERAAAAERTRKAQEEAAAASQQAAADAAARAQADAQRKSAELAAQQADLNRQRAEEQQRQAAAAQQQAEEQRRAAEQAAKQAQADKEALRHNLLERFNAVLSTRDTPRGLVANLSDVLFATNSFQLRQNAQLTLAKFAGIVEAYPGLHLQIEGHTDSTGGEAYNQKLSEKRANSVRDFLTAQGVPGDTTTAAGMGQADPVAPNTTAAGRQQNRRVEIVVSGDVIGQPIGSSQPTVPTTTVNPNNPQQ
jgi:outer membrane protein OmpA-like peptidoglycan-associated protein